MSKFIHHNKVHMYDTDAAGILYFANQYRFVHDAFEALMEKEGYPLKSFFKESPFFFVIVHSESDYKMPLYLGDELIIHVSIIKCGTTSFTFHYDIYRGDECVGSAQTVHVCMTKETRQKQAIPKVIKDIALKYSNSH